MSYRFMRVLVFFDLPVQTSEDMRNYRLFRKTLLKNGFFMMQESVYCRMVLNPSIEKTQKLPKHGTYDCRMVLNPSIEKSVINTIRKAKPPAGLVQVLSVTEKQF